MSPSSKLHLPTGVCVLLILEINVGTRQQANVDQGLRSGGRLRWRGKLSGLQLNTSGGTVGQHIDLSSSDRHSTGICHPQEVQIPR